MWVSEKNFIKKLKKKDEKALEYVIDNYSYIVNSVCRKILYNICDNGVIEECIYDVFMAVWDNALKFDGDVEKFKSWIGLISRYKAIDYYRKHSKEVHKTILNEEICEGARSPLDEMIENNDYKNAIELINTLSDIDRKIISMRFILGYSSKEVAILMDLSVGSIDTRTSRARKKLREDYKKVMEV